MEEGVTRKYNNLRKMCKGAQCRDNFNADSNKQKQQTPWPGSVSELYRPSACQRI
jgi:hypothetical protein